MAQAFVSKRVFIAGLIIAILGSSVISVVAMTQLSGTLGLKGEKGDKGDIGATGATGATGMLGNDGIDGRDGTNGSQGPPGPTGILNPDYDSGWVTTDGRIVNQFNHNLGTSDVFVYILCKWYRNWTGSGGPMVHQFYYGGDSYGTPEQTQGFYWDCYIGNPNMIEVSQYGGRADELRVLIWKLPEP
jgi:hypothetical protein